MNSYTKILRSVGIRRYSALLPLLFWLHTACTVQPRNLPLEKDNIKDAYWVLLSLEGKEVSLENNTQTAYLRLQENDDDVSGFTGCNRLSGTYTLDGENLTLSGLRTTRMACTNMETENKMLEVLQQVNRYQISGDVLTLFNGREAVATFMTGNPERMRQEIQDRPTLDIVD